MRLLSLEIKNIASIESANIDFAHSPLSDCEVFLISGPTGAGKSTILDAICLAMYGDVPRMATTNMTGRTTPDVTTPNPIAPNSVCQLMRLGTGEASATLYFTSEGKTYMAGWYVRRAHKRPTGSIQPVKRELSEVQKDKDGTGYQRVSVLTKNSEIDREISRITGLDFRQFCRTTMLAQGEFTRFLKSKDDEKADILEKITGKTIFKEISEEIHRITDEKIKALQDINTRIDLIKCITPAESADYEKQISLLQTEAENTAKQDREIKTHIRLLESMLNIDKKIATAQAEKDEALASTNSETYKKNRQTLSGWRDTVEVRRRLDDIKKSEEELAHAISELKSCESDCRKFKYSLDAIYQEGLRLEQSLDIDSEAIESLSIYKNAIENAENILELARKISENKKRIHSIEARQIQLKKDVSITKANLQKSDEERKTAFEDMKSTKAEIDNIACDIKKYDIDSLTKKYDVVSDRKSMLIALKSVIEKNRSDAKRLDDKNQSLKTANSDISRLHLTLKETEQEYQKASEKHDTAKNRYEWAQATTTDIINNIRLHLSPGCECPVCGNIITEAIPLINTAGESVLETCRHELKEAESLLNELTEKKISQSAAIDAKQTAVENLQKELEYYKTELQHGLSDEKEKALRLGLDASSIEIATIDCEIDNCQNESEGIRADIQKYNALTNRRDKTRHILEDKEKTLNEITFACQENSEKLASIQAIINEAEQNINDERLIIKEVMNTLQTAQGAAELGLLTVNNIETAAQTLTEKRNRHADLTNKIEKLRQEILTNRQLLQSLRETEKEIAQIYPAIAEMTPIAGNISNPQKAGKQLLLKISSATEIYSKSIRQKEEATQYIQDYIESHDNYNREILESLSKLKAKDIDHIEQQIADVDQRLTRACETLAIYRREQIQLMDQYNASDYKSIDEKELHEMSQQMQSEYEEKIKAIGNISQLLTQNSENSILKQQLLDKREIAAKEASRWERFNGLYGGSSAQKFKRIALSFVLGALLRCANTYLAQLTNRYKLRGVAGTYQIDIIDAYQGGMVRSANTSSGGESFMVSLALALALSDISRRWSVDMLFIDEGFGTLSQEPLRNAVGLLKSLHQKSGRRVGIISHIEELRSTIDVQILLEPDPRSGSTKVNVTRI